MAQPKYVSALSLRWLTPFYDRLIEGPMSAMRMRQAMLASMGSLNGKSVLDVGCGTGTFAIVMKSTYPDAQVTGLDGDPQILEIARLKARRLHREIEFTHCMSYAMPYPDASFDFVVTSLMLHHLDHGAKVGTAREMYRVLKPGGELIGLDFAEPRGPVGKGLRPVTRHLERMADNVDGLLPVVFREAGFRDYAEVKRFAVGIIALFRASK